MRSPQRKGARRGGATRGEAIEVPLIVFTAVSLVFHGAVMAPAPPRASGEWGKGERTNRTLHPRVSTWHDKCRNS